MYPPLKSFTGNYFIFIFPKFRGTASRAVIVLGLNLMCSHNVLHYPVVREYDKCVLRLVLVGTCVQPVI
jgi:hypothetical protein